MALTTNNTTNFGALQQPFQAYGPSLAVLALVIGLSYLIAENTWKVIDVMIAADVVEGESNSSSYNNRTQQRRNVGQPVASTYSIINQNLFGKVAIAKPKVATTKKVGTAPANKKLAETRLPLILQGVFLNDDDALSRALIAEKRGKRKQSKSYGVGDDVPGNAVVSAIHKDHVVLQRGVSYETLRFPKKDSGRTRGSKLANASGDSLRSRSEVPDEAGGATADGASSRVASSRASRTGGASGRGDVLPGARGGRAGVPPNGLIPESIELPEGVSMQDVLSGKLNDPEQLSDVAQSAIKEFGLKVDEETNSLVISPQAAALGGILGIKAGDEVKTINDHTVPDIIANPELLMELYKEPESLKVELKSGSTERRISIPKYNP